MFIISGWILISGVSEVTDGAAEATSGVVPGGGVGGADESTKGAPQVGTDHWTPVKDFKRKVDFSQRLHGLPVRSKARRPALMAPWFALGPSLPWFEWWVAGEALGSLYNMSIWFYAKTDRKKMNLQFSPLSSWLTRLGTWLPSTFWARFRARGALRPVQRRRYWCRVQVWIHGRHSIYLLWWRYWSSPRGQILRRFRKCIRRLRKVFEMVRAKPKFDNQRLRNLWLGFWSRLLALFCWRRWRRRWRGWRSDPRWRSWCWFPRRWRKRGQRRTYRRIRRASHYTGNKICMVIKCGDVSEGKE